VIVEDFEARLHQLAMPVARRCTTDNTTTTSPRFAGNLRSCPSGTVTPTGRPLILADASARYIQRIARRPSFPLAFAGVLCSLAVAAACSDDKKDPNAPKDVKVENLAPTTAGTCLLVPDELGKEVKTLPVVRDCTVSHNFEIYAKLRFTADGGPPTTDNDVDVYPGEQALADFAELACLKAFGDFVGISQFDSRLHYSWLLPTLDGWTNKKLADKKDPLNSKGDHAVLCALTDPTSQFLPSGTMKDSKI
jgi:hypothetical protein